MANWVSQAYKSESLQYIYEWLDPDIREKIWECNLDKKDVREVNVQNKYWLQILENWCEYHYKEKGSYPGWETSILWYNSEIRIENKPIRPIKRWLEKGIMHVRDLLKPNSEFKTLEEIKNGYGLELDWLFHAKLQTVVTKLGKAKPNNEDDHQVQFEVFISLKKPIKYMYEHIVKANDIQSIEKYYCKWSEKLQENITINRYINAFVDLQKITDDTKLQSFQYRLLLNKIFTNDVLYHWKIEKSQICNLCKKQKQSIEHLMIKCEQSSILWRFIQNVFDKEKLNWSTKAVILNQVSENQQHVANTITLICKHFIFRQKCLGSRADVEGLKVELSFYCNYEKRHRYRENPKAFQAKWGTVLQTNMTYIQKSNSYHWK